MQPEVSSTEGCEMDIIDECRHVLAAAKPANSNQPKCQCNVTPVPSLGVELLLNELEAARPRQKVYERPIDTRYGGGRIVLHPAPWVRRMIGAD